jgi:hypothetical protein
MDVKGKVARLIMKEIEMAMNAKPALGLREHELVNLTSNMPSLR